MTQRFDGRRGSILIAVLACTAIATTILLGAVQSSLRHRQQLRQDLQLEQTRWLLDAGVGHAIASLNSQPAYDGETIRVDPAFEQYPNANVQISVIRKNQPANLVRVRVTAQLSRSGELAPSTRRSMEFRVNTSRTK